MKVGEIWEYCGKCKPHSDGLRWSESEEDDYWYMEKVVIQDLFAVMPWGEMVHFTDLDGNNQIEAVHSLPRNRFIKEYRKKY